MRPGDPASPLVNTNADYWTRLVGIAWDRDVDLDFDREPVDLDGDGKPDTTVTRHIHAKGGILANPELFGLTPTPDDPRGRVGRVSASTGVLGLREPLGPDGKPTGQIGMTCWLCHGEANPTGGAIVLGLPGVAFDYGLLLATAAVLDDGERGGRRIPARPRISFGPHGARAAAAGRPRAPGSDRRVRARRDGARLSLGALPGDGARAATHARPGQPHQRADDPGGAGTGARELVRLRGGGRPLARASAGARRRGAAADQGGMDRGAVRRALLFDLRNLGTLGLQQDSFPGLLWSDAIYGHATLSATALAAIPKLYAAPSVRAVLAESFARPPGDAAAIARGRVIFSERVVGAIANRQILKLPPPAYAAGKLEGPILAPIDPTRALEAKLAVRCADCHSGAPLENKVPLAANPPPLGRCSHCHLAHSRLDEWAALRAPSMDAALVPVSALPLGRQPADEVAFCEGCHSQHRDFGPLVYSSGRLYPFDADGDGDAQRNPAADRKAGGIGTDSWLAFDVARPEWPFAIEVATISNPTRAGHIGQAHIGAAWVRAAPLLGLAASAPYLHNGSVPSLRALLDAPSRRPVTFPLGKTGFVLDTRLPGNSNQGHDFGTALTAAEKTDLVAFLESL